MAIALACGPPSSFDNLTDGPRPGDGGLDAPVDAPPDGLAADKTLKPPQPTSPASVSWVNGSSPHFSWRLPPDVTSAVLEIRPSRSFAAAEVRRYEAVTEVDAPDLTPGVWYWHLLGKTADSIGTVYSPTWEVLVRGGSDAGGGKSGGSLVDIDGNGVADLIVGLHYADETGGSAVDVQVVAFLGNLDGTFTTTNFNGDPVGGAGVTVLDPPIAVSDVNGDGYTDVVVADIAPGGAARVTTFAGGSPDGVLPEKGDPVNVPPGTVVPTLRESIDFDGDGFGDIAASTDKLLYTVFGTARGLGPLDLIFSADDLDADAGARFTFPTMPFGSGFDRNGDGLGDVALTWPLVDSTILLFSGDASRISFPAPFLDGSSRPTPPTAYASGDMDGDGKPELAYVATFGGKPSVCVLAGTATDTAPPLCWSPATAPSGFASSLIAADLEPDGKDEILVGSSSGGVDVLSLGAGGAIAASHIDTPYGARLTAMTPGRPLPAIWASTRADATSIQVWKGNAPTGARLILPTTGFGTPPVFTPLLR